MAAAIPQALVHGFQRGFAVAALFALAASLVAAVVIKARKPSRAQAEEALRVEAEEIPAIPGESTEFPVVAASPRLVDDVHSARAAEPHSRVIDTRPTA
jgi:hypothetical protein